MRSRSRVLTAALGAAVALLPAATGVLSPSGPAAASASASASAAEDYDSAVIGTRQRAPGGSFICP